jgi:hypothetical protein
MPGSPLEARWFLQNDAGECRSLFCRRGDGDLHLLKIEVLGVRAESRTVRQQLAQRLFTDAEDFARGGIPIEPAGFDGQGRKQSGHRLRIGTDVEPVAGLDRRRLIGTADPHNCTVMYS